MTELRRDKHFPADTKQLLADVPPSYEGATHYRLMPGMPVYLPFLEFLIEELKGLPLNNEVGETILMRSDAREVVAKFVAYLEEQKMGLEDRSRWIEGNERFQDTYKDWRLEVFKNEIYRRMNRDGVCYSVDLSAAGTGDDFTPIGLILERYYVDARETNPEGLTVTTNGSLEVFLSDGEIRVDTVEMRTNAHDK